LHYHPADPSEAEIFATYDNADLFEFVELENISTNDVDLTHVQFVDGITFAFTNTTILAPGERLVLVSNQDAFEFRYGMSVTNVAGVYTDNFRNSGEHVRLEAANASAIADFTYGEAAPWPDSADGAGYSLVFAGGDPTDALNWRSSTAIGGNPGGSDSTPFIGGDLRAYALADGPIPLVIDSRFLLEIRVNLSADDARMVAQFSTDLHNWTTVDDTALIARINHGDGTATLSFLAPLSLSTVPIQYGRIGLTPR
jgi:hypothetical protein